MHKLLIGLTCLSLVLNSNAQLRVERDQLAKDELEKLNFFYKGRGMVISPDMVKIYEALSKRGIGVSENGILNKRWGLNLKDNRIIGFYNEPYKNMAMGVLGCVACHSGKAAGEIIIGLGNKNIDVGQIGKDAYLAELVWGTTPRPNKPEFREIHKRALKFTSILRDDNINNLTQGLVPTSQVKSWFYEATKTPMPQNFGRGQVKVPHLWGYGEKRKSGSFWDGFADGVLPGWAVAVEVRGGQSPENVREYLDKVHHAEDLLSDLLPPKYPLPIDQVRVLRGKHLFNQSCIRCHGTHEKDAEGHPLYLESKFIPWEVVKTDEERLDFVTDEFLALIDKSPLNDLMKYKNRDNRRGYVAPLLWGIWSRFPYLHNGSVPTLMDLLTEAGQRPAIFDLRNSGEKERFDSARLGLNIERDTNSKVYKELQRKAQRGHRTIYDTNRVGHNNQGHDFAFYKMLSIEDKKDLIEFLKTL
jgi:hypothetical protein